MLIDCAEAKLVRLTKAMVKIVIAFIKGVGVFGIVETIAVPQQQPAENQLNTAR